MLRSNRRIALATAIVALVALVGIYWIGRTRPAAGGDAADSLAFRHRQRSSDGHGRQQSGSYYAVPVRQAECFPFDPNTADSTQLLRLGLQPWQVRNIYKYRARGGIYRTKEDFARLYGLTVKDYRRLEPYIRISSDYLPASTLVGDRPAAVGHATPTRAASSPSADSLAFRHKISPGQHIVLNTADTTQLMRVPGIGSYYAREIARYGRWLGGYVSVDQLDEIDGLPQECKQYFVVETPTPQKINLNKLTLAQLRRHPYINFYQAKTIVDYRRLRGPLTSLGDLRLSRDFPPEAIRRLEPYVEF